MLPPNARSRDPGPRSRRSVDRDASKGLRCGRARPCGAPEKGPSQSSAGCRWRGLLWLTHGAAALRLAAAAVSGARPVDLASSIRALRKRQSCAATGDSRRHHRPAALGADLCPLSTSHAKKVCGCDGRRPSPASAPRRLCNLCNRPRRSHRKMHIGDGPCPAHPGRDAHRSVRPTTLTPLTPNARSRRYVAAM